MVGALPVIVRTELLAARNRLIKRNPARPVMLAIAPLWAGVGVLPDGVASDRRPGPGRHGAASDLDDCDPAVGAGQAGPRRGGGGSGSHRGGPVPGLEPEPEEDLRSQRRRP